MAHQLFAGICLCDLEAANKVSCQSQDCMSIACMPENPVINRLQKFIREAFGVSECGKLVVVV
jgi:hypothetical protein